MNVTYTPSGPAVSDFNILETAKRLWKEQKDIETSSAILITAFRVLVKRGIIPAYTGVVFLFEGVTIRVDTRGTISDNPIGFCEALTDLHWELLGGGIK